MLPQREDSFLLRLGNAELWFTVRPVAKTERLLPYVGKLEHPDFEFLLIEIEPEEPARLDRLFDEENTFVIGCEAFVHYTGIKGLAKSR